MVAVTLPTEIPVRNYAVEAAARPVETGLAYDLPPRLRSGHAGVTWVGRFSSLCGSGVLNQTRHDGSIRTRQSDIR